MLCSLPTSALELKTSEETAILELGSKNGFQEPREHLEIVCQLLNMCISLFFFFFKYVHFLNTFFLDSEKVSLDPGK